MSHTRPEYRRALGHDLGGLTVTNTSSSTGSASTLEVSKQALSSVLPTTALGYVWAFVPDLVSTHIPQARVTQAGLNAGTGVVTLEAALGAPTVVGAGVTVELHTLLPAVEDSHAHLGGGSLDSCVNRALRHLRARDDSITMALVSGQQDYDLSAYVDFLDRADVLLDIRVGNSSGSTTSQTAHHWEYRDGVTPHVHFVEPYAFGSGAPVMTLVVKRRCDTLIRVAGVWGISTVGLVNETDEAKPSVNDVVTVAKWFALLNLAARNVGKPRADYLARAEAQLALAQRIEGFELGAEAKAPAAAPAGAAA